MSNSLNFLNKPASPKPAPIGPQPKPGSAGSPTAVAPKSAYLDKSNPWNVGKGTPPASLKPAPARTQPAKQQPARTQPAKTQRAVPTRGYNYTDASYTGTTPQQRAHEVDQAQMAAQATQQRREREQAQARAQAQQAARAAGPPPLKVQAREFARPLPPAPPPDDEQNPWSLAPGYALAYDLQQRPIAAAPKSLEQRAAEAWIRFVSSPTPEAARASAQQPTAPAGPRANIPTTGYNYTDAPPAGMTPNAAQQPTAPAGPRANIPTTGYNYTDAPPAGMTPNAAQAGTSAGTNVPAATGQPLFYGYAPPGPLTVERTVPLQGGQMRPWMTNRPLYTELGTRAMLSDAQLAAEDAMRQRDAAGSQTALNAVYRPWNTLTDAEKYQRRFGVMPQGAQMTPDTSTGVAAQAASAAQRERLNQEYWDRYGRIIDYNDTGRRVRPPLGQYEGAPRTGTEPIQRGPSGQAARQAAPAATQATALQEAQALAKRYLGGLDTADLSLQDIVIILSRFNPSPDLKQQFDADMIRLAARIPSE